MAREVYIQWKDNPTVTTINTSSYPITNVDFPAITICSQGSAKDILDTVIWKQFEKYLVSKAWIKPNIKKNGQMNSQRQKRSTHRSLDALSTEEVNKCILCLNCTHQQHI